MTTLKFADSHNMVAFLSKSAESEGFEQIATIKMKIVNGVVQLQALVDKKKIIITEVTIRRYLQLEDAEVKNLDNAGKFLMYPRFIQVLLDNQLEEMATHNRIYISPSHKKKIFANMRRQRKDFSGRITPLFPTMVVQAQEEMGESSAMPTDPQHTPIITQPSSSQPQRKQKSRRLKRKDTEIPQSSVPSYPTNVADEDMAEKEVSTTDLVTTAGKVVTTANVAVSTVSTIPILVLPIELTTTTTTIPSKNKGKGIMVEEPLKMKKKDQISFDEQEAIRLQAEFDEEVRLAREKDEANVALIEEWNDI
ncbi:hypothetical protein Tco_0660962 [Tanacetum coccineum]